MGKYRDRLQIIADILAVVRGGARKTHIMYQANLSFTLLKRYLGEVLEAGLAWCDKENHYQITQRGRDFLERFTNYSRRYEQVEVELNNVSDEKTVLEDIVNNNLNRRFKRSSAEKKD